MPINQIVGRVTNLPAATCDELNDFIDRVEFELARVLADAEIDALADSMLQQVRNAASLADDLNLAVSEKKTDLVLSALTGSTDILFELASFSSNPQLIASAAAVKIVADTGVFAVQVTNATGSVGEQLSSVGVFAFDRATFYVALAGTIERKTPIEKAMDLGSAISSVGFEVTEAAIDWARASTAANTAGNKLRSIENDFAPALLNIAATRKYRNEVLRGQLAYGQMVRSFYSASGCKATGVPIVRPTLP